MKHRIKPLVVLITSLILILLMTGIAQAITITVDGTREAAWDGLGGQTPGSQTDVDEGGIDNTKDISRIQWTNDTTYMYFLVQTHGNISFDGDPQPAIYICLDTDNNSSTGDAYANCNGMTGIERTIRVRLSDVNTPPLTVRVTDGAPTGTQISSLQNAAYAGQYLELRVSLNDLGIDSAGACNQNIQGAVYFDGGTIDPDDNIPDSGTVSIGCGTPTAVTLSSTHTKPSRYPWMGIAVGAAGLIGVGRTFVARKRRKAQS
jgi:hypothetical protein